MKRSVIILVLGMLIATGVQAQDAISKFFSKYEADDSFTHVSINKRMIELFTNLEMETKEDEEIMNAISKLQGLKILAKEDTPNAKKLYDEAFKLISSGGYDELMSVRDGDTNMKFMIKESGSKISELLMVIGGEKEFFILSLFGTIDLKQIAKMSKAMEIDGLKGLEKLGDQKSN